jgi:Leucine-rich repeat (LRR) protein
VSERVLSLLLQKRSGVHFFLYEFSSLSAAEWRMVHLALQAGIYSHKTDLESSAGIQCADVAATVFSVAPFFTFHGLRNLSLDHCGFELSARHFSNMASLSRLKSLNLSRNKIDESAATALANAFTQGQLKVLTALHLYRCGLTAASTTALVFSFRFLKGLQLLDFGNNKQFDSTSASHFCESIKQLARLRDLYLYGCELKQHAHLFISGLSFRYLETLNFGESNLGGPQVAALLATVAGSEHLRKLYLSECGDSISSLSLPFLPRLELLNVSCIKLGDRGMAALVPTLANLPSLEELDLSDCNVGNAGISALSVALAKSDFLPKLSNINCRNNPEISDAQKTALEAVCDARPVKCEVRCSCDFE